MAYTYEYPRPTVTVDAIVFWLQPNDLQVLLIKRKKDPFGGCWGFPGGFMDMNEPPEVAVTRELEEETGLKLHHTVQIGAFGAVNRDPRHRTVSIAYLSVLKDDPGAVEGADDAAEARWFSLHDVPLRLAFDHKEILTQAKVFADMYFRTAVPGSDEAFGLSQSDIDQLINHVA
ncbi:NUDIX hydrolase [Cesiribacter sp. SM1]|uniref:NUDIX domain-containing protein n=1 Tax=Cesiribacter sp. SM1 TaxID=2861196 RepID=UPI001CD545B6|nr:NUDIX hydrolase [Cesiribacter sp. SM1]